jgi:surface-anchored protein
MRFPFSTTYSILAVLVFIVGFRNFSRADIILKEGHVDLAVTYLNGNMAWRFNADGATSEAGANLDGLFTPQSMVVRIPDAVNINNAPPGSNNNVTGYSGSGSFFWLPSSGSPPGAPFLGWAWDIGGQEGEIDLSEWNTGIRVQLAVASMPTGGHFSLWGGVPSQVYVSTFNPTLSNQGPPLNSFSLPGHDHFNWGFTEAGIYDLTFQASGTHVNDGFRSATATFRFLVGSSTAVPEPTSMALLFSGLGCTIVVRKYLKKKESRST